MKGLTFRDRLQTGMRKLRGFFERIDGYWDRHEAGFLLIPSIEVNIQRYERTRRWAVCTVGIIWFRSGMYLSYSRPFYKITS